MKKELDTYRKQLYTYAAFVKQRFGVFPEKLVFNMFRYGEMIEEKFDPDQYQVTLDWICATIERIENELE